MVAVQASRRSPPDAEGRVGLRLCEAQPLQACGCAGRCRFCGRLDPATLAALSRRSVRMDLPANVALQAGARPAVHAGVLVHGWLRRVSFGRDGRRRILGLVRPGELVEPPSGRSGELETATPVRLWRFERAEYERLRGASPSLRREELAQARRELERLQRLSADLAALNPEERLAAFLAASAEAMPWEPLPGGGGVLDLDLPRADIADLLGTTIESISRISRKFHREGLIRIVDPRRFAIPDLGMLARRGSLAPPASRGRTAGHEGDAP